MGQLVIWPWPWWECLGFPSGSMVKESAFNAGDSGLIPELERSPGGGNVNPLQYSCLENPIDRGTWWATVQGVAKSRTQLKWLSTHTRWECLHHGDQHEAHIRAPQPQLLTLPDLVHLQHITGTWGPKKTFSMWPCGLQKTLNFSETFVSHLHHSSVWYLA